MAVHTSFFPPMPIVDVNWFTATLPYLHHTRSSTRRYRFDYEEQDHIELLEILKGLPCSVILSGYRGSNVYDELLTDWGTLELQVMNQGGVRTEKLWFNFTTDRVHWCRYAGKNFTDRQRIKRKAENWGRRYQALPRAESSGRTFFHNGRRSPGLAPCQASTNNPSGRNLINSR